MVHKKPLGFILDNDQGSLSLAVYPGEKGVRAFFSWMTVRCVARNASQGQSFVEALTLKAKNGLSYDRQHAVILDHCG